MHVVFWWIAIGITYSSSLFRFFTESVLLLFLDGLHFCWNSSQVWYPWSNFAIMYHNAMLLDTWLHPGVSYKFPLVHVYQLCVCVHSTHFLEFSLQFFSDFFAWSHRPIRTGLSRPFTGTFFIDGCLFSYDSYIVYFKPMSNKEVIWHILGNNVFFCFTCLLLYSHLC